MTLVRVDDDERYPVWIVREIPDEQRSYGIDVAPDTLARWQAADKEWEACQEEMQAAEEHARARRADRLLGVGRIIPSWPPTR